MHLQDHSIPLPVEDEHLFYINSLAYSYPNGRVALRNIDFAVRAGDRLAIVGANGSGKSTLARHLNGLLVCSPPEKLLYKGEPLTGERLRRARFEVGLLFQDPDDHLFCNTLFEDVAFGPMNQGLSREQVEQRVESCLQRVDLLEYKRKPAHSLSYGQKKRAALAAIMAMEPETLILDEPTANLDPVQVGIFVGILNRFDGTLICISHDLFFLQEVCSRALVLQEGRVHHDYTMEELMSAPEALREHGLDYSFREFCCKGGDTGHKDEDGGTVSAPVDTEGAIITLSGYSFAYRDGTRGLNCIDLSIRKNERIALIGENGAGKTTLALCLTGILEGRGLYCFNSHQITKKNRSSLWKDIGIIFQDPADQLFCPTCREEVAFGLRQRKMSRKDIATRVGDALELVGLSGYGARSPLDMSGGERKRLAIAATICLEPKVLIMDEPTAGLDPRGEEMFYSIVEQLDVTILLISHDMFFIRNSCRRALVMHRGKIIHDCNVEQLFADNVLISKDRLNYHLHICGLHSHAAG